MSENMKLVIALSPVFYELGGERKTGERFPMREKDVERHVALKMVTVVGEVTEAGEVKKNVGDDSLATLRSKWTVSTAPTDYLKRFPNGPNAALALQILELEQEEKEAADALAAAGSTGGSSESPLITTSSIPQE